MKLSIKIYVLAGAMAALATGSCTDSFLDVPPQGQMTPGDYFSTSGDAATELVNAVYNALLQTNMHGFPWLGVASITSDDAEKGSSPGDTGTDKDLLQNFTFGPDAISFDNVWEANYVGIIRANYALNTLPHLTVEKALKKRLVGEASFLRAYFYWNLVRCFGGVPLITFVPDPSDPVQTEAARTRATAQQVYERILADLDAAVDSLTTKAELGPLDLGRATSGAALGLRAKVNMYMGNWPAARSDASAVVLQGLYNLDTPYDMIWREAGENTSGSLFEVQCRGLTPNTAIGGFTETQGIRGMFGWGFNTPSQSLIDAYPSGDTRYDATVVLPGMTLWDGTVVNQNTENPYYNYKAYVSQTKETYNGDSWQTNKNYRVLRYADILLILCEALYHDNPDDADIYTYLSQIRTRAGLTVVTASDFSTPQALLDEILLQRRLELAMENDRFFDLIRQGEQYGQQIPEKALGIETNPQSKFSWPKNKVFPIPQKQRQLSGFKLSQNPGYGD